MDVEIEAFGVQILTYYAVLGPFDSSASSGNPTTPPLPGTRWIWPRGAACTYTLPAVPMAEFMAKFTKTV